ncbi:TA system VapC family ribonuclease toxin [Haloferula sp. A504]|uniref:TA system VapC family ribonuclease toxin n=1 Tax=Haloferula sp. A504 TaxID=3373601 RepID=UPI0031CB99B9|nr:hypothetical protein [Verrucomicrobiaceae bacterium E54]
MRALFDINVLLARFDRLHDHHGRTQQWFRGRAIDTILTCTLTENGFLRIFANPAYPTGPGNMRDAAAMLSRIRSVPGHDFVAEDRSILDPSLGVALGSNTPAQITDLYLLALAVRHDAKFVTLDTRIDPASVKGGTSALVVIPE